MADIEDAPVRTLAGAAGAHIVLYYPAAPIDDNPLLRLPLAELDSLGGGVVPDGVLTAEDVGLMAYEDPADFISVSAHAAAVAAKDAQIADLNARLSALEASIGIGSIVVFDADVFETGVFA